MNSMDYWYLSERLPWGLGRLGSFLTGFRVSNGQELVSSAEECFGMRYGAGVPTNPGTLGPMVLESGEPIDGGAAFTGDRLAHRRKTDVQIGPSVFRVLGQV